jgi:hypothetical protein
MDELHLLFRVIAYTCWILSFAVLSYAQRQPFDPSTRQPSFFFLLNPRFLPANEISFAAHSQGSAVKEMQSGVFACCFGIGKRKEQDIYQSQPSAPVAARVGENWRLAIIANNDERKE